MISFCNDYCVGACQEVLNALNDINQIQFSGYGLDEICEQTKKAIQKEMNHFDCDIHFLVGGTQANTVVIKSLLRPHEAVIACDSGHINVHETGSIEAVGHKVLTAKHQDGKLLASDVEKIVLMHKDEHMVKPKMVYISNATEYGTIYSLEELQSLRKVCDQYGLYLFLDGARLASALMSVENNISMSDLAQLCDVFYIGGTKNGALFGEAVVILNNALKSGFRYIMKQHGAMLAKGWLLGLQFKVLFEDELYFKLANHANQLAQQLQLELKNRGVEFLIQSSTNQIFPIVSNALMNKLAENFKFEIWEPVSETHTCIRFVCSFASTQAQVDQLLENF